MTPQFKLMGPEAKWSDSAFHMERAVATMGRVCFILCVDFIPFLLLMTVLEQMLMTCRTPMNTGETLRTFSSRPLLPSLPRPVHSLASTDQRKPKPTTIRHQIRRKSRGASR